MIHGQKVLITLFFIVLTNLSFSQELRRYLYLSTPDGAQSPSGKGKFGSGILIFDIDNNYEFVRRIKVPSFSSGGGLRGFEANLATGSAYFSYKGGIGRFDLINEEIVWEIKNKGGFDRCSVPLDGSKIYCPKGWWFYTDSETLVILDAENGDILNEKKMGNGPHNSFISANNKYVYTAGRTWLYQISLETEEIVASITTPGIGDDGEYPFSVTSDNKWAYTGLYKHVGFDVVDLVNEKLVHRVTHKRRKEFGNRTHGTALSHDETEVWISDIAGKYLWVYDVTVSPPVLKDSVAVSYAGHGWVYFSSDGKHVLCHTEDIIDAKTKKIIATLKDENGFPLRGSKFFEAHFKNDSLVWVSKQFGLGYKEISPFYGTDRDPLSVKNARLSRITQSSMGIFTIDGKLLMNIEKGVSNIEEYKSELQEGIYFLKTKSGSEIHSKKFIVLQ